MKNTANKRNETLLIVMMLTVTLSSMSILLFNFVLPLISEEFHLTNSQVNWVTSSYTLLYGVGTAIYGKLADRFKLKHLLTFGLMVFSLASLLGFFSTTYWLLLVSRCLQAVGAAAIPAAATLIPIRYYPMEQRGKAMGTVFAGVALGSALGPITSAMVVSVLDWRWLFCIPLLLLATLPFYLTLLGDEQKGETMIDWLGGALLALSVAQLLLAVTMHLSWLIGGVVSIACFIVRIRVAKNPFVQPALFRNREYSLYIIVAFVVTGIGYSLFFITPIFLADVQELQASQIGLAMVPAAAFTAILNRQGGKLADAKGTTSLFLIASALVFSCFMVLSTFISASAWLIACFLILGNVGQSFLSIAMSRSISFTLPAEHTGIGMGLLMMQNFISGSIAIGIYGRIIDVEAEQLWNPLSFSSVGAVYSNLFLALALLHVVVFITYRYSIKKISRQNSERSSANPKRT
ncbi:MFS transporter, DHA2 family, metal-tetracycline-proton antiporter [Evansella caseinilytica]|uniref:MFS transporter, DHA2 family, metal-tetracycline-proton antiporter n=1 Tax=Evansella caseinilytica TaxID=1503961 RepID=A0A1H3SQ34_9BACI|nr:MFS transporter [Evansella caseinilytica]SDZ39661.1 MFS transporter, DHA2 family, metal-tetracycline-proton antiporter [Evansella caseinilytica]